MADIVSHLDVEILHIIYKSNILVFSTKTTCPVEESTTQVMGAALNWRICFDDLLQEKQ